MSRRNPPKDIDSTFCQGGECAVWSLAAATGRSIPDARRAFLDAGVDIWTDEGYATGTKVSDFRRVLKHLDWDRRVVKMGMVNKGTEPLRIIGSRRMTEFISGSPPESLNGETWDVRDVTVGALVDQAKREGLAMIGVVQGNFKIVTKRQKGKIPEGGYRPFTRVGKGSAHMIGYSPKMGFYDTSVSRGRAGTLMAQEDLDAMVADPVKFYSYGDNPPNPRRKVAFWVLFKGE